MKESAQTEVQAVQRHETKGFAIIHVFERMMPRFWQMFFEQNLNIKGKCMIGDIEYEDIYQYHAFVLKKNRFTMM